MLEFKENYKVDWIPVSEPPERVALLWLKYRSGWVVPIVHTRPEEYQHQVSVYQDLWGRPALFEQAESWAYVVYPITEILPNQ